MAVDPPRDSALNSPNLRRESRAVELRACTVTVIRGDRVLGGGWIGRAEAAAAAA
jgi:hypothetical protein